ncbi:MAG TPA: acylphosphatase [Afipia sp.]
MDKVVRRVVVRGKVQGVGYRAWTQYKARRHGLDGWVRNRTDGTVEAVFAGPAEIVQAMIEACAHGPRLASVTGVDRFEASEAELALRGEPGGFVELPTL